MKEILEVPSQFSAFSRQKWKPIVQVGGSKQLHPHHCEDENYDRQNKAKIAQGAHGSADDADEEVQCWPGLCQFEDS